jgi:hypothetical protein
MVHYNVIIPMGICQCCGLKGNELPAKIQVKLDVLHQIVEFLSICSFLLLSLATALHIPYVMYCLINEQECFIRFKATSAQREWL